MSVFNNFSNILGKAFGMATKEEPLSNKGSYASQAFVKGGERFTTAAIAVSALALSATVLYRLFGGRSNNNDFRNDSNSSGNRNGHIHDNARIRR